MSNWLALSLAYEARQAARRAEQIEERNPVSIVENIARVTHEANRALQHIHGDPAPSPAWDDAPAWQRTGVLEGVQAAIGGAQPWQLHHAWCAAKMADGWRYGPVKDPEAKTHPCMVEYSLLPPEQRAKDVLFHAIVRALTSSSS